MFIIILIIVLMNFFTSTGWLDLLNKIFKPTYDLLHFIVPLTVVTSILFVLVPIWYPTLTFTWLVGCTTYVLVGFFLCCSPNNKVE